MSKFSLGDHMWLARVGDIYRRKIFRRPLVSGVEDSPASKLLETYALPAVTKTIQGIPRQEPQAFSQRPRLSVCLYRHLATKEVSGPTLSHDIPRPGAYRPTDNDGIIYPTRESL